MSTTKKSPCAFVLLISLFVLILFQHVGTRLIQYSVGSVCTESVECMQVESGIRGPESRDEEDGAMSDRGGTTYTRQPLLYVHYVNFKVGPWAGIAKSPPSSTHFPVITLVWIRSSLVCLFICSFSFFTSYSSFSFLLFFLALVSVSL